jgi:ADP-ribose pyrophosphatase YjhB (NUDIX family)
MAAIRHPQDGALLVSEYTGPESPPFHRLIGGHVELMEKNAGMIHREFAEELAQAVTDVQLLGVLENIFTWRGRDQHEIVFIYTARLEDPAACQITEQRVLDDDRGYIRVIWRAAATASPPLYPDGVTQLTERVPVSPGRLWVDGSVRKIIGVRSLTGSYVIPAGTEGVVLETRPGGACLVDVVLTRHATGPDGDFHQAWLRPGQYVIVDPPRPELPDSTRLLMAGGRHQRGSRTVPAAVARPSDG